MRSLTNACLSKVFASKMTSMISKMSSSWGVHVFFSRAFDLKQSETFWLQRIFRNTRSLVGRHASSCHLAQGHHALALSSHIYIHDSPVLKQRLYRAQHRQLYKPMTQSSWPRPRQLNEIVHDSNCAGTSKLANGRVIEPVVQVTIIL